MFIVAFMLLLEKFGLVSLSGDNFASIRKPRNWAASRYTIP